MAQLTKRQFLIVASGAAAAAVFGLPKTARSSEKLNARLGDFLGGVTPQETGISLDMPEIAENGSSVPLTISIDGEATSDRYAESVLILADGNPEPGVATFHFTPLSGSQEARTRMRLAQTQNVVAVAKMSDGSFLKTQALVKVTIGGCGG